MPRDGLGELPTVLLALLVVGVVGFGAGYHEGVDAGEEAAKFTHEQHTVNCYLISQENGTGYSGAMCFETSNIDVVFNDGNSTSGNVSMVALPAGE